MTCCNARASHVKNYMCDIGKIPAFILQTYCVGQKDVLLISYSDSESENIYILHIYCMCKNTGVIHVQQIHV